MSRGRVTSMAELISMGGVGVGVRCEVKMGGVSRDVEG
jgi:hypothetical protein